MDRDREVCGSLTTEPGSPIWSSRVTIETRPVNYTDGPTSLTGYFAWDGARIDRRPGILVIHGGAGLDDHARGRARRLAALGYVALACDMYGEGVPGNRQRIMETIAWLRIGSYAASRAVVWRASIC